jgi:hypothetical protein
MEAEHECLRKMREDRYNRELTISYQEGTLVSHDTAPDFKGEGASRQGETACKERAPGAGHYAQDGGGAQSDMGDRGTEGLGLPGPN